MAKQTEEPIPATVEPIATPYGQATLATNPALPEGPGPYPGEATADYPTRIINGLLISKVHPTTCPGCGRATYQFMEFGSNPIEPKKIALFGSNVWNGRSVVQRIGTDCSSCRATRALIRSKPGLRTTILNRGVHRDTMIQTIKWCEDKHTHLGEIEAEALGEVLASNPGEWIPPAAFNDNTYRAYIEAIYANIACQSGPPDSVFPLGTVFIEQTKPQLLSAGLVTPLLDRHAIGDHGTFGPAATKLSEDTEFCEQFASVAEQNFLAVERDDGVVLSRFEMPIPVNRHPWFMDIATWLSGTEKPVTYVLASIDMQRSVSEPDPRHRRYQAGDRIVSL